MASVTVKSVERPALKHIIARADDCALPLNVWENEGGSHSKADEPDLVPDDVSWQAARDGFEWDAFSSRYFPGRHRHDLEALKAYEAYRSFAAA